MSTEPRPPRSVETREAGQRATSWTPPVSFPTPAAHDDVVFHWVRTATLGQPDPGNVSRREREGWVPVPAREVPELHLSSDQGSKYPDGVEVSGLLLCRNSAQAMAGRRAYYETRTSQQMESVDHSMFRQQDKRVPMYRQRSSQVTLGRGRSQ